MGGVTISSFSFALYAQGRETLERIKKEKKKKKGKQTGDNNEGKGSELVSLVNKVQHTENKGGLICDIRAKRIIMKVHRTREKRREDEQHVRGKKNTRLPNEGRQSWMHRANERMLQNRGHIAIFTARASPPRPRSPWVAKLGHQPRQHERRCRYSKRPFPHDAVHALRARFHFLVALLSSWTQNYCTRVGQNHSARARGAAWPRPWQP